MKILFFDKILGIIQKKINQNIHPEIKKRQEELAKQKGIFSITQENN